MSARSRTARFLALILLAPLALTVLPALAPPAEARTWGDDPLDDVVHWAGQKKKCGLSTAKLAALMLAPTFPETGAPPSAAPSPMTMSRWDNQSRLHSFSSSSSYRKAFWHPGIGPWQFDSAGLGAEQSAGARIDTFAAAEQAASTIADRWCTRRSKSYVWAPWYGCGSAGAICTAIFNAIYQGGRLVGLDRDGGVRSLGGMERRRCSGPGAEGQFLCHRVDPSRAQGHSAFTAPKFGPAPISAPYYVYVAGGHEYRFWRKSDSGYDIGVWAKRALGANARSGLSWSTGQPFRDRGPWVEGATPFVDIRPGHWAEAAIQWAVEAGMVTGYSDGTFRPDTLTSRGQMVLMLWRQAGKPDAAPHELRVGNGSHRYDEALSWATARRIVTGGPNRTFRPNRRIARVHMVTWLWRMADRPTPGGAPPFTDVPSRHRSASAVAWASETGVVNGFRDRTFRPDRRVRRANAVRVLQRALSD